MNLTSLKRTLVAALFEQPIQAFGKAVASSADFVRPADTTAYNQMDVVSASANAGAMLEFTNMARVAGGSGYITKAVLKSDNTAMACSFRLHLFNSAAATSVKNDNAPFLDLYADRDAYVGYIDFDTTAPEATGAGAAVKSQNTYVRLGFATGASTSLFGILELRAPLSGTTFAPVSGQKFHIKLLAEQN